MKREIKTESSTEEYIEFLKKSNAELKKANEEKDHLKRNKICIKNFKEHEKFLKKQGEENNEKSKDKIGISP